MPMRVFTRAIMHITLGLSIALNLGTCAYYWITRNTTLGPSSSPLLHYFQFSRAGDTDRAFQWCLCFFMSVGSSGCFIWHRHNTSLRLYVCVHSASNLLPTFRSRRWYTLFMNGLGAVLVLSPSAYRRCHVYDIPAPSPSQLPTSLTQCHHTYRAYAKPECLGLDRQMPL
ncbi:hypothetical protein BT96DRAFT_1010010 [Gymnopus androsaceus JB14]|uniref:Uncharacterized protein n=1 Tax=Gymnopus androsaceus JB14 TaxID=1447944 RepID=A0A6A4GBG0_9AGAR|nr:hypothetical protein BT96DRAFT_1010010 [Gymnopus androsaceus JB14]